jgi:AraC-like DNA-binding protein
VEFLAERGEPDDRVAGAGLHAVCKPSDEVRSLLARDYVGFTETSPDGQRWTEPPRPTVTVILNLAGAFGGFPNDFVAGLADSVTVVESQAGTSCIDLKLTPLGAFKLLGVPMHELTGRVIDLRSVLPSEAPVLDAVREEPGWHSRFAVLDALLARRAAQGPRPAEQVCRAWERLVASEGRAAIGSVAGEVGWSGKHLIAMFKQQIGLPPKAVARILRFHGVVRRLNRERFTSWADAAAASGYSDQSHLIRDFGRVTGKSPGQYLRQVRLDGTATAAG